jgi:ABC-2 type transport system ATP-binding protein
VGVVGNNGAGKTTLLRLMLDLLKADSGNVCSRGIDVSKDEKWKTYTSAYLDTNFLIAFLTPEEYFAFISDSYGKERSTCKRILTEFRAFMNGEILSRKKYIRDFSSGNRQKIGVIGSVLTEPEILILDEPFNYLDPTSQFELKRFLKELNAKSETTMVISSHNLEHIIDLSSRIVLIENGKIVKDLDNDNKDTKDELTNYFELFR